ncbi:MAG TPA: potassium-transporting ATPase subunit KdpC [Bacteroidales bacterium]|nr:potassium-transporting ATPase subunit KdpC [Bacteroidales bacterium]
MKSLIQSLKMILAMTVITGILYPLFITGIAQTLFPSKANGSLIRINGTIRGSRLIGQKFDTTYYIWSRPSATGYDPNPSGASNLALTSKALHDQVEKRTLDFMNGHGIKSPVLVPAGMIFTSGSGLDPDITPYAALLQVNRVAKARHWDAPKRKEAVRLIDSLTQKPEFLIFGNTRINVLLLNLELDKLDHPNGREPSGSR